MPPRTFIDTNILVYAHDAEAGKKHDIAREIVEGVWEGRSGCLSLQVLQEFYVTVTQKISRPLARTVALKILEQYRWWEIVLLEVDDLFSAVNLQKTERVSFWDSLILQAALKGSCSLVISEDMQHQKKIGSLTIRNPFIS